MKKLVWIFVAVILFSCQDKVDITSNFTASDALHWITDHKQLPAADSLFYLENPAPLFRKELEVTDEIQSARLLITSAGYFSAFLNGEKIGNDFCTPAWTDFSKRIYFSEYDVTDQLENGLNCIGVTLGNGFYNPLPLRMWGRRNLREVLRVGKPAFIAKLQVQFKNGKIFEINTDESWKYSYGPVRKNNVYLGVVYNGGKEIENWDLAGFDDEHWLNSITCSGPGGTLQKEFFPPVQVTDTIQPVEIVQLNENQFLVDMGVNFTGTYKINLVGNTGDSIVFRFGERIFNDGTLNPLTTVCGQIKRPGMGGPGAPDVAWQTDTYVFGPKNEVTFQPDFTFHTFRYIEISGLNYKPTISDINGLMLNSNVASAGNFTCSSDLINSIQEATRRTFLSNLVSVQSDCAAREKFGYGGDLNATSESFICNFNMHDFYRKTIYDWVDTMNDSVFVDTAPYVGIKYCGISWESAFLTTQYYLYLYYNDIETIKEFYHLDKKWMEKVERLHPKKLVESGLSDHESLEPVPVELTGTCHYLQCAQIMTEFARIMGDSVSMKKYANLADELRLIIKEKFWDNPFNGKINRQTLFASLIYFDIIPENEIEAGIDSLLQALESGPAQHFTTGIFGTKYILEALSKTGNQDLVYKIVNSNEFPGWGYMIERGATTIWETWKESENTYSNCHPMFGSVTEWFYRWLGGIQPISGYPGFEKFKITPFVSSQLQFANCKYQSPFGEIVLNWKKNESNNVSFQVQVPDGSSALFKPALCRFFNVEISNVKSGKKIVIDEVDNQTTGIELEAGNYNISGQLEML